MQKYWKFILLAVVVAGILYYLTRSNREGLTSNPSVENPLPGQGPQAGQGTSMTMSPPPSASGSSSGSNLASSSSPVGGTSSTGATGATGSTSSSTTDVDKEIAKTNLKRDMRSLYSIYNGLGANNQQLGNPITSQITGAAPALAALATAINKL